MIPTIIVHGGAKTITEDKVAANHAGCTAAAEAGWAVLINGGTAKDAVEAAIRVLEADPTFNASLGATLNSDGEVELDVVTFVDLKDVVMICPENPNHGKAENVSEVRRPQREQP